MLVWLLPTFLWSGEELDESDRPFQNLLNPSRRVEYSPSLSFQSPVSDKNMPTRNHHRKRIKKTRAMPLSKRIATVIRTVTSKTSFSKVYNSLLCPQCIARIGLINGAIVSLSELISFFSFVFIRFDTKSISKNLQMPTRIKYVTLLYKYFLCLH